MTHKQPPAVEALKPCPFCGCAVDFRRSMQVQHPENDCWLSGICYTDENCTFDNIQAHKWNTRVQPRSEWRTMDDPEIEQIKKNGETVLICIPLSKPATGAPARRAVFEARYHDGRWTNNGRYWRFEKATAWCHLPPPPAAKTEG